MSGYYSHKILCPLQFAGLPQSTDDRLKNTSLHVARICVITLQNPTVFCRLPQYESLVCLSLTRKLLVLTVKRKLLDSRMLPIYDKGGWIELNVRQAVRQWRSLGKNFGLVVEVENEDGDLLKASEYFTAMNCSNEACEWTTFATTRVLIVNKRFPLDCSSACVVCNEFDFHYRVGAPQ